VHDIGCSRRQALGVLGVCLDAGVRAVCAFDTTGCGRSGGRHVSLGWHERFDLACVLNALAAPPFQLGGPFVIWGRGLGAVAAVLCADADAGARLLDDVSLRRPFSAQLFALPAALAFARAAAPRRGAGDGGGGDAVAKAVAVAMTPSTHGLTFTPLPASADASALGPDSSPQLQVSAVAPDSPAARAGVRVRTRHVGTVVSRGVVVG
jgi:hypothetical protein